MRQIFSVGFKAIAGFFLYSVCVLAFISGLPTGTKLFIMLGFATPAVIALLLGLLLSRFQSWQRDSGAVLLGSAAFSAFAVLMFACFLMTDEFKHMIQPDHLAFFGDYWMGAGFIVGFALLGALLVKRNTASAS
ncbi:hypothetical protein [Silvimonas iriomotensis]|uniref:Integron gene cassette protein n=1 Tax=Silvimonas iriomotensis TaxID=449662 RepID=A0ABQ2PD06_9NEIS|nr:hypothetical protein [Silvimonas iriomotensis]GGP23107.1 hypothetical protein GCM10010970_31070 [Silvimonas iriomotensis]